MRENMHKSAFQYKTVTALTETDRKGASNYS